MTSAAVVLEHRSRQARSRFDQNATDSGSRDASLSDGGGRKDLGDFGNGMAVQSLQEENAYMFRAVEIRQGLTDAELLLH